MFPRKALRPTVVVLAAAAVIGIPVPVEASDRGVPYATVTAGSGSALTDPSGVASRGDRRGRADREGRGSAERGQAEPGADNQAHDDCPTQMWTLPIELRGVLCVLLLEKHEEAPAAGGSQ
jgi:hypothetical protein